MAVVVLERTGTSWADFREHLVAAIERHANVPDETAATAYYTALLDALETLLSSRDGPAQV